VLGFDRGSRELHAQELFCEVSRGRQDRPADGLHLHELARVQERLQSSVQRFQLPGGLVEDHLATALLQVVQFLLDVVLSHVFFVGVRVVACCC